MATDLIFDDNLPQIFPAGSADLEVTCWCEWKVVMVPANLVRAGQTLSCGSKRCDAIAKREAK